MTFRTVGAAVKVVGLAFVSLLASSQSTADPGVPESAAPGALRAAGVVHVGTVAEFRGLDNYNQLLSYGVEKASIVDGSLVIVRALCCSNRIEKSDAAVLYNPQHLPVADGDFVELRVGNSGQSHELADAFNTLTRVFRHDETACRWEPKDDKHASRRGTSYVYCDWMPDQGWLKQETKLGPTWYKPAPVSADNPAAPQ